VAYVHGILIKAFLSDRRRRSSGELPTEHVPEEVARDADPAQRLALMAALADLGELDRAVVVLRYWEDRSVAETADQLGLSVAAVRNRSLRALRSLRGLLDEDVLSATTNGSGA
jgi:RNA polymerase sigma factor (sigma-70 family)